MAADEVLLQVDTEAIAAVVDTNVLVDLFSCHDVFEEYERLGAGAAVADPRAVYRRARARESLLLAMHFQGVGAYTYSVREPLRIMLQRVDPEAHDAWPTHYTKVFVHFVRERLLPNWRPCMPTDQLDDPVGNAADAALVSYASTHGLRIVSNEASTPTGIRSDKLRKKAAAAGVVVVTPKEFYDGLIDEAREIQAFLERFRTHAPGYIASHPEPSIISDTLGTLDGYFRHTLLGETKGEAQPVKVAVV